ncbi:unnamed protein product [Phytophthora fragariaefolia]|uniref:Unnamed protein product n=1 Tax=Phytophthora fragariaefolia TaxID=1490495 RepID=A0A9W7CUS1_9STRA|nr:unnamed protein product [Phytophthora fragariaefolia]
MRNTASANTAIVAVDEIESPRDEGNAPARSCGSPPRSSGLSGCPSAELPGALDTHQQPLATWRLWAIFARWQSNIHRMALTPGLCCGGMARGRAPTGFQVDPCPR